MIPNIRKALTRFLSANASNQRLAGQPELVPADARLRTQDLPPAARDRRLRYKRFAARQMLVEVERQADQERDQH